MLNMEFGVPTLVLYDVQKNYVPHSNKHVLCTTKVPTQVIQPP